MGKWSDWQMDDERLHEYLEKSIAQDGVAQIYTVLNHVSGSGMTRCISAFTPLVENGHARLVCIAREKRIGGCGIDMGFALAYGMCGEKYPFDHHWL